MLIALPNTDGSFTATLFLARTGAASFAALDTPAAVAGFFAREFPDAAARMPQLLEDFARTRRASCARCTSRPGSSAGGCCCSGMRPTPSCPFTARA